MQISSAPLDGVCRGAPRLVKDRIEGSKVCCRDVTGIAFGTIGMDEEEERRARVQAGLPRPLVGLSVGELETYKRVLQAEILRVDTEIADRQKVRGAAEALFRAAKPAEG